MSDRTLVFSHPSRFAVIGISMVKKSLIGQIFAQLEQELRTLLNASDQAHQSATDSENKAENKYDTLGLEAAYLAHGLSIRALELRQAIATYYQWTPPEFKADDAVRLGALITLEDETGRQKNVFLAAQGGGVKVVLNDAEVTVITPSAPLGKALLNKCVDDEVTLTIRGTNYVYSIVAVT